MLRSTPANGRPPGSPPGRSPIPTGRCAVPGNDEPYLPTSAAYDIPYKNQITIRQLLGHRAGVFDVANHVVPASDVTMVIVSTLRDAGDGAGELAWFDETATMIRAATGY